MAEFLDSHVNDVLVTHLVAIADAICGEEENASYNEDALRHALGRIAAHMTENGAALPAVTAADNGKVMKVVDGKWVASAQ